MDLIEVTKKIVGRNNQIRQAVALGNYGTIGSTIDGILSEHVPEHPEENVGAEAGDSGGDSVVSGPEP